MNDVWINIFVRKSTRPQAAFPSPVCAIRTILSKTCQWQSSRRNVMTFAWVRPSGPYKTSSFVLQSSHQDVFPNIHPPFTAGSSLYYCPNPSVQSAAGTNRSVYCTGKYHHRRPNRPRMGHPSWLFALCGLESIR